MGRSTEEDKHNTIRGRRPVLFISIPFCCSLICFLLQLIYIELMPTLNVLLASNRPGHLFMPIPILIATRSPQIHPHKPLNYLLRCPNRKLLPLRTQLVLAGFFRASSAGSPNTRFASRSWRIEQGRQRQAGREIHDEGEEWKRQPD